MSAIGDRVLGLASSGLHSNGYTLAREAVFGRMGLQLNDPVPGVGRPVVDELLEPTRIYVEPVLGLLRDGGREGDGPHHRRRHHREPARACCRGAAAPGSTPSAWPVPPIFAAIQRAAAVDDAEMRRTFNMGLGFLLVVAAGDAAAATQRLEAAGERVFDGRRDRAGRAGRWSYV